MRKYTREDYQAELNRRRPNCGITVGDDYINTHKQCTFFCETYGEFKAYPNNVIRGGDHPKKCSSKLREKNSMSREEAQQILLSQGRTHITILDDYICAAKKCTFRDAEFGEWRAVAYAVLTGGEHRRRSIIAARPKRSLSKEECQRKLNNKHKHRSFTITIGDDFTTVRAPCTFIDSELGPWLCMWPYDAIRKGWLHPNRPNNFSQQEQNLRFTLQEEIGKPLTKFRVGRFEIDIFDPETKVGIEFNGLYWHSEERVKDKKKHINKTKTAAEKGIRLVQIWESQWRDRKPQVINYLKSILCPAKQRIFARKCVVVEVSTQEANSFLDLYHIQGARPAIKYFGLSFKGELVSLISISDHHRGKTQKVLSRFVTKTDVCVVGALGKLANHAANYFNSDIITWVDRCLSDGSSYEKAGFVKEEVLSPDYFYVDSKTYKVIPKQSRQKKKVHTPEGMTEGEHAKLDGLWKIWDCGKIRFKYTPKTIN